MGQPTLADDAYLDTDKPGRPGACVVSRPSNESGV